MDTIAVSGKEVASALIDLSSQKTKDAAGLLLDKAAGVSQAMSTKAQDAVGALADKAHDMTQSVTSKVAGSGANGQRALTADGDAPATSDGVSATT